MAEQVVFEYKEAGVTVRIALDSPDGGLVAMDSDGIEGALVSALKDYVRRMAEWETLNPSPVLAS